MVFTRRQALCSLMAASAATAMNSVPATGATLRSAHRFLGSAVEHAQLVENPALAAVLAMHCKVLTPEYSLKWSSVAPDEHSYDFSAPDALVSYAAANGMLVRGHTLLWERSTPAWALEAIRRSGTWSPIALHFETVLSRYPNIIDWDVVNEPIDGTTPDGLRRDGLYAAFGPDYIERALRLARELRPTARLAINEYGLSYATPYHAARRAALLRLIRRLRDRDVPLDCVGLQTHLDLAAGGLHRETIVSFLEELASCGLQVVITELDVKEADRSQPVAIRDAKVAREVSDFLTAAFSVPAVTGVITWGLSDRHSWLQDALPQGRHAAFADLNRGLPFDAQYRPKPMLDVLHQAT